MTPEDQRRREGKFTACVAYANGKTAGRSFETFRQIVASFLASTKSELHITFTTPEIDALQAKLTSRDARLKLLREALKNVRDEDILSMHDKEISQERFSMLLVSALRDIAIEALDVDDARLEAEGKV